MRVVRVGAAGTAMELARLFRGVPMVLSTPSQPRGVVSDIGFAPQLVIATPGAEPRVRGESPAQCEYRAVAILDAWTSLYASGIDADVDTLTGWMRAVSRCAPRTRGGQALLIGETDPVLARSLMLWNSPMLAQVEVEDRAQTALLLWNTAGRPEPAEAPAFADVADPDTAKAAQWCVEQGIMEAKTAETFKPEGWTPKLKVIEVWNKAFPKQ